jgi:hypothetical protein
MGSSIWNVIDPANGYRPSPTGGYTSTDNDAAAATQAASSNPLNIHQPHFGFLALLAALGAGLWWTYEGKGSGAKVSANLGPVGGTVEGGLGKDE